MSGRVWVLVAAALALAAYESRVVTRPYGLARIASTDPRGWTPVLAGNTFVSQSFVMRATGFDGVRVAARAAGDRVDGTLEVTLYEQSPAGDAALFTLRRPAADVVNGDGWFRFRPLPGSLGRLYRIELRLPQAAPETGIQLERTHDGSNAEGFLVIDWREQWGDLVFDTSATGATMAAVVAQRARRLPTPLRQLAIAAVLAALNLTLLAFVWFACQPHEGLPSPAPTPVRRTRLFAMLAALAVVGLVAGRAVAKARVVPIEPGAIDLLAQFDDAERRTTMRDMRDAFAIRPVAIDGRTERSLLALPPSRVYFDVPRVPEHALLKLSIALDPDTWYAPGDGAVFRVGVSAPRGYTELRRQAVQPQALKSDRRRIPLQFDLSRWAGRPIRIVLNTEPGEVGNAVNDAALWGAPRIVPGAARR